MAGARPPRRWCWLPVVAAGLAFGQTGCTPLWERHARQLDDELAVRPAVIAARSAAPDTTSVPPARVADLDALVAWAIDRHPEVRAELAAVEREVARLPQVTALPEPVLQVSPIGSMAETAAGQVDTMIGLSQRFPRPGEASARAAEVAAAVRRAEVAWQAARLRVARELRGAWWNGRLADRALTLIAEQQALIDDLRSSVDARLASGEGMLADRQRLVVERAGLDRDAITWRERRRAAEAALRAALALDAGVEPPALADAAPPPLDLAALAADVAERHPAHLAAAADAAAAEASRRSARVAGRPSFGLSAQYNFVDDEGLSRVADGTDQWWIGASMSLPLWVGSYAAADREAEAAARRARHRQRAAADQVDRDLVVAIAAAESAREQEALLSDEILPAARDVLASERAAYAAGEGTFAELVRAWRQVLALELQLAQIETLRGTQDAAALAAAGRILPPAHRDAGDLP